MKISTVPLSRHWAELARPDFYASQPSAEPMRLSPDDRAYLTAVLAGHGASRQCRVCARYHCAACAHPKPGYLSRCTVLPSGRHI